jgi:hypothetical protein
MDGLGSTGCCPGADSWADLWPGAGAGVDGRLSGGRDIGPAIPREPVSEGADSGGNSAGSSCDREPSGVGVDVTAPGSFKLVASFVAIYHDAADRALQSNAKADCKQ